VEIKLIIKNTLNTRLIITFMVFIYFSLINLTYANENFIVTIVNKIPISKIDITNKAKLLSYSIEKKLNSNNLPKFYNQALENLINEKVILSEGLKINKSIENLVKKQSENLLLAKFKNSEIQLTNFLKELSIPKSTILDKYKTQLILGYLVKQKYKSQLNNLETVVEKNINSEKNLRKVDLFELAEIVINKKNNYKLYNEIQSALQNGANFLNIAKQVSMSSSSRFNGKIGWKTFEEASRITKNKKNKFVEGDILSYSTNDKIYFFKILAIRLNGQLSKKENKVLLVEAKFPINFKKKEKAYMDVKKRLDNMLSHKSKCNNLAALKNSSKFNISLNTIKTRLADISSNIQYLIKNIKLYEVSKPLFSGNNGFAYIICDRQKATKEEINPDIIKNKMMNKHFSNLANKLLKRLNKQAQVTQIQKLN
jgi:hypothetical protein